MKKRSFLAFVICITALVAIWKISFPTYEWYYKITIAVETPEGVKTGSAVRHVGARVDICPNSGFTCGTAGVSGEAVVVDLGERGTLFALTSTGDYIVVFDAFPYSGPLTREGMKYYSTLKDVKASVLHEKFAVRMVHFKDMNDPLSVELVYGAGDYDGRNNAFVNDISKIFGEGVKLKDITIEMVEKQPFTSGIVDKYLPKTFKAVIQDGWRSLSINDRSRLVYLTTFKSGAAQ